MSENDSQNGDADNGWRFIDNDLDSGFVIKIKQQLYHFVSSTQV